MFKKLVIASAVLAASSGIAFAGHSYNRDYKGEMSAPTCPTCSTYTFLSGPYVGFSASVRNNYSGAPDVYKGLEGILSLGYAGVLTPSFYLAGEIFAGNSFKLKDYIAVGADGVRTNWNYGISIIPGVMLTDYIMGYVRAGWVRAHFNDVSANRNGWQVGVGGQANLCQNWDLRTEYVYSQYSRISTVGTPRSDQFNVGVVYKFM